MSRLNFAHWNQENLRPNFFAASLQEYPSLGLAEIAKELRRHHRPVVVDLGPAQHHNIEFFSGFPGKLYVEDLYRSLLAPAGFDTIVAALSVYPPAEQVNALFCWDLLNYLQPEHARSLLQHFFPRCAPGCLVYALNATASVIPEHPSCWRVLSETKLSCEITAPAPLDHKPFTQRDLAKLLPGWKLVRSLHWRNFMQETVYVFAGH